MALKFNPLKVSNVKRETEDTVSITFDVPQELRNEYLWKHGQYITLKFDIQGQSERRAYSICSSPVWNEKLSVAVKKADDGFISKYINEEIKIGDIVEVLPPMGNFTNELDKDRANNYIMIGGGSGITPLMSIIKTILKEEPKSNITLLYASRDEDSIIFKSELDEIQEKHSDQFKIEYVLSKPKNGWKGMKGRINYKIFNKYLQTHLSEISKNADYFLCGPSGLMAEVLTALDDMGVDKNQIYKESFTADLPKVDTEQEPSEMSLDQLEDRKIKMVLYGEESEFTVKKDETILMAAQREGYDPPFSCQIGACSTCRAKLEDGKVYMEEHDALTQDEMDEGYVLTCQAHPVDDKVIIDYDQY